MHTKTTIMRDVKTNQGKIWEMGRGYTFVYNYKIRHIFLFSQLYIPAVQVDPTNGEALQSDIKIAMSA